MCVGAEKRGVEAPAAAMAAALPPCGRHAHRAPRSRACPPSTPPLQATVDKQQFAVRITAETGALSRLLARCDAALAAHPRPGSRDQLACPAISRSVVPLPAPPPRLATLCPALCPPRPPRSFHTGLEEVTLVALPEGSHRPLHVNSFIDPQKGGRRA